MKLKFIFLSVFISSLFFLSACEKRTPKYLVSLDDSLKVAIKIYAEENQIDIRSGIIKTYWMANPYRTDVYISYSSKQFGDSLNNLAVPSYYSIISDSIVVCIYSGLEQRFEKDTQDISRELSNLLAKKKVDLVKEPKYKKSTPTWLFTYCTYNDKGELLRKPTSSDLYFVLCKEFLQ